MPSINLPNGNHDKILINSDLHEMIVEWTSVITSIEQTILTHHGRNAGRSVLDVVPTLCYARISRSAYRCGRSQSTPARPRQWGSSPPSIGQRRDRGLQRRRVDRARDPHPNPGRKLNLDRAAASWPDWTRRRP